MGVPINMRLKGELMNFIVVLVFELCQVVEKEVHGGRYCLHTVFNHSRDEKRFMKEEEELAKFQRMWT